MNAPGLLQHGASPPTEGAGESGRTGATWAASWRFRGAFMATAALCSMLSGSRCDSETYYLSSYLEGEKNGARCKVSLVESGSHIQQDGSVGRLGEVGTAPACVQRGPCSCPVPSVTGRPCLWGRQVQQEPSSASLCVLRGCLDLSWCLLR